MQPQIQIMIEELEQQFNHQELNDHQLYQAQALYALHLDYSDASLEALQSYLSQIELVVPYQTFIQEPANLNFVLFLAHYLCKTINHRTQTSTQWYLCQDLKQHDSTETYTESRHAFPYIATIQDHLCDAPSAILALLAGQTQYSLLNFVDELCGQLTTLENTQTDTVYRQYLGALQQHRYLPGGNAYHRLTQLLQFDGSFQSVEELSCLLYTIKELENLTPQSQAAFLAQPSKLHCINALSFYLGYVVSVHSHGQLKWFSILDAQAAGLLSNETEPKLGYVARYKNICIDPFNAILEILFTPIPEQSCLNLVQKWIYQCQDTLHIFPSSLRIQQHEMLPQALENAFKSIGTFAAELTHQLKKQQSLAPQLAYLNDQQQLELLEDTAENRTTSAQKEYW